MTGYQVSGGIGDEAYAVTTSDTADNSYSYLYVGTAGNVVIIPQGGTSAVTLTAVPAGQYVWCRTSKVTTATTASNIVGFR